jgi:glutathione S-transferase
VPHDRFDRADMLRWMFWEQYNHEPNIATLRFWYGWIGADHLSDLQRALLPGKQAAGEAALALMDERLGQTDWLVGGRFTLADIILYAYTHVAEGGGFTLSRYPAVRAWLGRVAAQSGHIPLDL